MPEFVVEGGLDDRTILEGFKRITAAGEDAGRKIDASFSKSTGGIQATGTAATAASKQFTAAGREIQTAANGLRFWIDAAGRARAENGRFVTSAERAAAGIGRVGQEARRAGAQVEGFSKSFRGLAGELATLGAGAGLAALFKQAIDRAVQLETITRKLSNTLGQQGAAGALQFTKGLADDLGLSFTTLAGTFGSFTAAATAAGVPIETQRQLFAAVAKSAQALGLSNEELGGSLLALQQTASKGVVSMEELRGQLGERLPIAFGATAKGLGITQQQLIKLVESGKLTASEFFPALTKGLKELTANSSGPATAAQNFEKLGNAWAELQASFGKNLLPGVVAGVQQLTKALEEVKVQQTSSELRGSFGVTAQEADQLVGSIRAIQQQYGLTFQQGKNLLSNAIANTGASRDWFGELNLGGERFSRVQTNLIDLAKQFREANPDADAKIKAEAAAAEALAKQLQKALDIDRARAQAMVELNALRAQEPVRRLDDQLAVGTQLNGLAAAAGALEQSRFDVVRARVQFEIDNAERLGITQEGLAARAAQQAEIQRQALVARFQALVLQQKVEEALLVLSQKRAAVEAQIAVSSAQEAAARAQLAAVEAQRTGTGEQIGLAIVAAEKAQDMVVLAQQRLSLLEKIQPIEAAIGKATAETAKQQLLAQGAALGIEQQLRSITPQLEGQSDAAGQLASGFIQVGNSVKRFGDSRLKDGVSDAAGSARSFAGSMDDAAGSAQRLLQYLSSAAGLPAARFTGGPVEGGGRYRINDGPGGRSLGQESFLSRAGDLSLIRNPLNSTWTAPTAGIVLPAAVTDTLKQRGAFSAGGGVARRAAAAAGGIRAGGTDPAVVHLRLAVDHLAAQVKVLNQKDWGVQVKVRNSAGLTQIRQINGLT